MSEDKTDRVYIRTDDREGIYDKLLDENGLFEHLENRIPYMLALTRGFQEGVRLDLEEEKTEGFILVKTLKERDKALIKTIAISEEEDLSVLNNKKKVFRIADEYAAGGIQLLKERIFGKNFGSYGKRLESELKESYDNIKNLVEA